MSQGIFMTCNPSVNVFPTLGLYFWTGVLHGEEAQYPIGSHAGCRIEQCGLNCLGWERLRCPFKLFVLRSFVALPCCVIGCINLYSDLYRYLDFIPCRVICLHYLWSSTAGQGCFYDLFSSWMMNKIERETREIQVPVWIQQEHQ